MKTVQAQSVYTMHDQLNAEATFYGRKHYFSYSAMSLLLWSPVVWYAKYVLNMEEEESILKHLIEGKLVHCLLLDNQSFDEQFIVMPGKVPTDSVRKVIEYTYQSNLYIINHPDNSKTELGHFSHEILDILKEVNLYQSLANDKVSKNDPNPKTGDDKRLEKILTDDHQAYWEFLMKRGTGKRTIIDEETLKRCRDGVEVIKLAPNVTALLGLNALDPWRNVEIFNEKYLDADLPGYTWGLKGFLDNYRIDHDERVIYINDLKTTSKKLADFHESVEAYSYWLQASIYILLILANYKHLVQAGYRYKFHFIVVDPNLQVYAFPVSQATLDTWAKRTQETFKKVNHHYTKRRYDLPYEFDLGLVSL